MDESKEQTTGTRDVTYDLISVLYHSLQASETMRRYRRDAVKEQDSELLCLFDMVIEKNLEVAEAAKDLLRKRFVKGEPMSMDDLVDEQSQESFPASDPPATY